MAAEARFWHREEKLGNELSEYGSLKISRWLPVNRKTRKEAAESVTTRKVSATGRVCLCSVHPLPGSFRTLPHARPPG